MKNLNIRVIKHNSEITELVNVRIRIQTHVAVSSETKHVTMLNLLPWARAQALQSSTKHSQVIYYCLPPHTSFMIFTIFQCLCYLSTHYWFSKNSIQSISRLNEAQKFTSLELPLYHCAPFYGLLKERCGFQNVAIKLHTDILPSTTDQGQHWHQTWFWILTLINSVT